MTAASNEPRFSHGEQVVINAPGWLWDRMVATVGGAVRAGRDQAWLYTVQLKWPNGDSRIYSVWEWDLRQEANSPARAGEE